MSGPELAHAFLALFGPRWRTAAADALGVSRETLWRHVSGTPGTDVTAVVEDWGRLAGYGVAPPAFPDGAFAGLPEGASCQRALAPEAVETVASVVYGERWRDALARRYGFTRTALWRQVSTRSLSGPLRAGLRASLALHGLTLAEVAPDARPGRRRGRRKPRYAALMANGDADGPTDPRHTNPGDPR